MQTGNRAEAYEVLKPVMPQVVSRAKASTSPESGFWNIEPEYLNAYDVMVNLLLEMGKKQEAVEMLDQLKTINDPALYQNPMVKSSLLNESELTRYERLRNQLDALRKEKLVATETREKSIQRSIDELSSQKQRLDRKISRMTDRPPVSLRDIQHRLAGSELILHITELNNRYYVARITKRAVEFEKIRLDSVKRNLFSTAVANLATGNTDLHTLEKIAGILKLQNLPSWIDTITIIPDSYLYQLPIDILPVEIPSESYSYGEVTYRVERFKTHYVTSINDLAEPEVDRTAHKFDFTGYGISSFPTEDNLNLVPLPFAKSEVEQITHNLTNLADRKFYLDSLSTVAAFKASAPETRILHLATHSEISEQDPLYSTIYMSRNQNPDNEFPGQIFAYELFELNLNSDLIMLNSCESGSGSYLQGTGIMGISRALRYAGAKSLVLNLWSVNDMMASDFAIKFYEYLNDGKSKTEALRLAKTHFIKEKNANPHYWGPYMLIGDKEPVVRPHRQTNIYFAASFMLYFILFIGFSLYKQHTTAKKLN